jgi:hypothetical protein
MEMKEETKDVVEWRGESIEQEGGRERADRTWWEQGEAHSALGVKYQTFLKI